jgi:virulence-associated protein VagC
MYREGFPLKKSKNFRKTLILRPKKKSWATLTESLQKFTDEFMEKGRRQPSGQQREQASTSAAAV